jgi:hypothetical protein
MSVTQTPTVTFTADSGLMLAAFVSGVQAFVSGAQRIHNCQRRIYETSVRQKSDVMKKTVNQSQFCGGRR